MHCIGRLDLRLVRLIYWRQTVIQVFFLNFPLFRQHRNRYRSDGGYFNIRNNSLGLNRAAAGGIITRSCQLESGITLHRNYRLNRTFAKTLCSHDNGPFMILHGAGDYFRSAGAAAVNKYDNRIARFFFSQCRVIHLIGFGSSSPGADYHRIFDVIADKTVDDFDALIYQAARVVTKIKNQPLQLSTRLHVKILKGFLELTSGTLLKLRYANESVPRVKQLRFQTFYLYDVANQFENEWSGVFTPHYCQGHRRTLFPPHPFNRCRNIHPVGWRPVDLPDVIIRLNAGPEGGCVIYGGNNRQSPLFCAEFYPDTAERTGHLDFHLVIRLGRQIGAVRIEGGKHSVDHFKYQFF